MSRPRPVRRIRRGSVYVIVLAAAAMVVLAGLTGLASVRVHHRTAELEQSWNDAATGAQSAIEHALASVEADRWWRETYADREDAFGPDIPLGHGAMSWRLDDLADNDLDDSEADPVRIYGRGVVGETVRVYSAMAWPSAQALDVLRTPLHASGTVELNGAVDARGGPVSTNGLLDASSGLLLGDVEADTVDTPSNVTGTLTAPSPAKTMPSTAVWDAYKTFATEIKLAEIGSNTIQSVVISPDHNPYNAVNTNPYGVYRVKAASLTTLRLQRCRIEGTLLVELPLDAKFAMGEGVVLAPARPDLPALIVYAASAVGTNVDLLCAGELSEVAEGVNFNPTHTPYYGESDADTTDVYPASIRGVVHVIRKTLAFAPTTTLESPRKISGCVIVDGNVNVEAGSILVNDSQLLARPPLGYTGGRATTSLLVNGDIEAGLSGWVAEGPATALVADGNAHSGSSGLKVQDRLTPQHGVRQTISSGIASGETYRSDLWLKMASDPEDVMVSMVIASSDAGTQRFDVLVPDVQKEWTRVIVDHTPTWTGSLTGVKWLISTTTTPQDFHVDDAILEPLDGTTPEPRLLLVPGTWRAEANSE